MIIYRTNNSYFDTEDSDLLTFTDEPKEARITVHQANRIPYGIDQRNLYSDPRGVSAYHAGDMKIAKRYLLSMKDLIGAKWGARYEGTLHYMDKWHADREAEKEQAQKEADDGYMKYLKKHGLYNQWEDERRRENAKAREAVEHEQTRIRYSRLIHNMRNSGYYIKLYSDLGSEPEFILYNRATDDWEDDGTYSGKDGDGRFTLSELENLFPG